MSRVLIGLPRVVGKLEKYASKYDMVEVTPVDTPLPKKLAQWRERVSPAFAFSVVLPKAVAALEPGAATAFGVAAATLGLGARTLLRALQLSPATLLRAAG